MSDEMVEVERIFTELGIERSERLADWLGLSGDTRTVLVEGLSTDIVRLGTGVMSLSSVCGSLPERMLFEHLAMWLTIVVESLWVEFASIASSLSFASGSRYLQWSAPNGSVAIGLAVQRPDSYGRSDVTVVFFGHMFHVEADSFEYHRNKVSMVDDRAADRRRLRLGSPTVRVMATEIMADPSNCAREIFWDIIGILGAMKPKIGAHVH